MHFTRESSDANLIHTWEPGRIRIGDAWHHGDIIVGATEIVTDWYVPGAAQISLEALSPAIALAPSIILLGAGPTGVLPDTGLMASLASQSIGLEIMTTPAACRTFNVLVSEERNVVAAIINPHED